MDVEDLTPGSRVALIVPGSAAYAELVIALFRRGLFPVPMDVKLTPSERTGLLTDLDPVLVVRNQAQLEAEDLVAEERDLWGFGSDDVHLVLSPMHHCAPLRFATGTLLAGGRVVVPGPFDPEAVTHAILRERPTTMFLRAGPPAATLRPLGAARHPRPHVLPAGGPRRSALPRMGQAPPARAVPRRLDLGALRLDRGTVHRLPQRGLAGATGHPGPSTPGEIHVCRRGRPPVVRRPASCTFQPSRRSRQYRSSDGDGFVHVDGRREDLVISGGVNVYPADVERVLGEVAGVEDIAVYGVEDDRWGQRVCAAVVGPVDVNGLREHAREHLAPANRPKEYHRLDALPSTPTGKVRRLDLPDLLQGPG